MESVLRDYTWQTLIAVIVSWRAWSAPIPRKAITRRWLYVGPTSGRFAQYQANV